MFLFFVILCAAFPAIAQKQPSPISLQKEGKLSYAADDQGNRIPDFSYAGYAGGDQAIPDVPVQIVVPLKAGDASLRIQRAVDYVSQLPINKHGFRGAVLLQAGTYTIGTAIKIAHSGVVIRGAGFTAGGTTLHGEGVDRAAMIQIKGTDNRLYSNQQEIIDQYVPVNAFSFAVNDASGFSVGDLLQIVRPSTEEWIKALGTDHFGGGITSLGWKPNQRNVTWHRRIVAIKGNTLHFDAPITTALDKAYGVSTVKKCVWTGRIEQVGIENIALESAVDPSNAKDEDHRWMGITVEHATNVWLRRLQFKHFAGSAVYALPTASKLTLEDCLSLAPVSEIGGQRRYTFYTKGEQTLFQRLYAENGYHDFAVGYLAAGPNVFVQCQAVEPYSFSGAIDSWSSGSLFDIVDIDGQALSLKNRGQDGQGAGWTAANSVLWQCSAALVECFQPPTAQNWAFGIWAQFQGDGFWDQSNEHIRPRSLYYAQLADRLGDKVEERAILMPALGEASSSPSVAVALELTQQSKTVPLQLKDFIAQAEDRQQLDIKQQGIKTVDQLPIVKKPAVARAADMLVNKGWLVRGHAVLVGKKADIAWWNGSARPHGVEKSKAHITRFVPGEEGIGLTDNLAETADTMLASHTLSMDHNYGLWYDRRRDDHERIRRMDGEVWPPFYELPFARSGQGLAYDGLSKYDLTKYNKFYWNRLKQFADIADEKGLVLIHQNYFQHNIIEAGAHYADFPWRTANNINEVGFPEPVPYAGDKRIFMAEQFYDTQQPVRRALHRAYIRQCLANFKDNTGVIQMISAEYTGPQHFVEFWLDVISEWKQETGKQPIIALSSTKDVQDAILADPIRAKAVQVIDIRYWHYQADGSAYEPKGGQNLAPRQHARLLKPKKTSMEQVYRAVAEYRTKYPDKAVLYHGDNYPEMAWAVFMAGGSMANIPKVADPKFLQEAADMSAVVEQDTWMLKSPSAAIVYQSKTTDLELDLSAWKGTYKIVHIHPKTGEVLKTETRRPGKKIAIKKDSNGPEILWITKT
ncbi:DUF6298 domain-containing protein [Sphingobacterium oryzagri]|uniref:DUF6298 domain-containing protein n=1 Tax=Sphingobacterium oryzagri TaxID=3025669 RepID=A0ABY7WJC3_9SPHI|nr:DUF6298 domain-containing protein [Sphingobacterium sp. KACC 22765]WDF69075.1 DUF6298 domain-containing protein [Sphingobacterium sp. KACC 22765]